MIIAFTVSLIAGVAEEDLMIKINNQVNKNIKYVSDWDNYGVNDYWAKPEETLKKGSGDCEDIALLKYAMLVKAGFSEKDVKVVFAVYKGQGHVYLEVKNDGKTYYLDNIYHYVFQKKHAPMVNVTERSERPTSFHVEFVRVMA